MKRSTIEAAAKAAPRQYDLDESFEKAFAAGAEWALEKVREWADENSYVENDDCESDPPRVVELDDIEHFCTI